MSCLCCDTGYSLFDVWTLVHIAFWVFVGSCLWGLHFYKWKAVAVCFVISLLWEIFEWTIAFPLWPDKWQDPESIINSWISDPLTCAVGVLFIWWLLDNRKRR